jgi:hypothetical protein
VRLRLFFLWRLLFVQRRGGDDLCIFPFDFLELFGSEEAYASSRPFCEQNPGNLFHIALAGDTAIFIRRALADRKCMNGDGQTPRQRTCCSDAENPLTMWT